jgi:ketosteroid isomerase-like protein
MEGQGSNIRDQKPPDTSGTAIPPLIGDLRQQFKWEFILRMIRSFACFSFVLFSCCAAIAQDSTPAPVAASAAANATSAESPAIREFQKIEDSWSIAVNERDQYGLELVLSPLFVDVSATGDITTRNQQVAMVITGEDKTIHLEQRVITVRSLGDIAVANGTYELRHKTGSGPADEKGVFTHVFERVHGGWLCINSQRTVLREETNVKAKKQSNAEMPFHIPLFSKSDKSSQ